MALNDYLIEEVALDCRDGLLTRRDALRRLTMLGVSATAATTLLAGCGSDDDAGSAASDDPGTTQPTGASSSTPRTTAAGGPASSRPARSTTSEAPATSATPAAVPQADGTIAFPGPNGQLLGVLATAPEPKGAVLVIHENRGLTPHIRSIPARLAADGYTALAIDLLSEEGGTASLGGDDAAIAALGAAPAERLVADVRAGLDELQRQSPDAKLAVIGFCFGGAMTWRILNAGDERISAAVPFYGPAPQDPDFSKSPNAAVLGIYAGLDDRVNATRETAESALTQAGLTHEIRTFDGVNHAFFNDTGGRYDATAAAEAYQAMLAWFDQHLAT
jgi:carboxymethylenebutenolidase